MLQNIEEKRSGNAVHNQLKSQSFTGLSETEAATRLVTEGYNEIPSSVRKGFFSTAVDVIREPMFLLLFACGAVYMVLGDVQEALMLLTFVFFVVALTLYQERKTEHALEALRDLSSPRALVIRDGSERRIAGREVVRDDILILSEGDRIPADAEILQSLNLLVDESLLTGESVPVSKSEENFMYSGTMVVQGQGIARVYATGVKTELGKIGKILQTLSQEETLLQKETSQWVRILSILGISLCFLVITFFGILHADWLNGVLTGITLAMAILPEELPVVLVIFLAMGAWRISKKQVLTRKMPAIETLGATSVLCVDKTGTLTMNRMTVKKLFSGEDFIDVDKTLSATLPEKFHALLEFGTLASQLNPFDPMEKAIKMLADQRLDQQKLIHQQLDFLHEFPLSKEQLSLSRAWKSPESDTCIIAAKGAPEAIIDLCHFDEEQTARMTKLIEVMADEGLRILGVEKSGFIHYRP